MYDYKAPVRDSEFVYFELFDFESLYQELGYGDVTRELWLSIAKEAAKFAEEEVAPVWQSGDSEGCTWKDGEVTTPKGFKEAYQKFMEGGWPLMDYSEDEGGQALPESVRTAVSEYWATANYAWSTFIGFGWAGSKSLRGFASKALQDKYIPKFATGEWLGTMCLTEPHCGTDLGLMRTKATPKGEDGVYEISGTKIFITSGEHDFTENIVHLVLAKIEGAPEGTAGISLFVVPKFLSDDEGNLGERNGVSCGSLEHKMGIKASATCVMNFDGAEGYIVGEQHRGLQAMFLMMNAARIGTGLQGMAHAELGLQKSVGYARERLQMRSLAGPQAPEQKADPIIVHPDVRRMLLTQKAIAEGGRMFVAYCARLVDINKAHADEKVRAHADMQLSFVTPIVKALLTELGFESSSLGMQCYGGHGYIKEWGMEQNVRDSRIAMLYEGTTGVQALDLLGRKMLATQGKAAEPFFAEVAAFCAEYQDDERVQMLASLLPRLQKITQAVGEKAMNDPNEVGAASVDYLMFTGYTILGYLWAKAANLAQSKIDAGDNSDFYQAKVATANFYYAKILPRVEALEASILNGGASLSAMTEDQFLAHL